jgi:hypothetical protein
MLDLQAACGLQHKINPGGPKVSEDETDAAERLERALERIARAARPAPAAPSVADTAPIAARLDQLIAQLRGALHS